MPEIKIQQSYFDNIQAAIDGLNGFFTSNFSVKNFPVLNGEVEIDGTILDILEYIDAVNPTWLQDPSKVEDVVEDINMMGEQAEDDEALLETLQDEESPLRKKVEAFVGFRMLQFIADHFKEFSNLINGIYSFDLFLHPSKYQTEIEMFSEPLDLSEIENVTRDDQAYIYSNEFYLSHLFQNDQIQFPQGIHKEQELERMDNYQDSPLTVVKVEDSTDEADLPEEMQQEAASVNYFKDIRPDHIIYDEKSKKFKISKQQTAAVNKFLASLRKCDTTEDLNNFFSGNECPKEDYVDTFTRAMIPCILARVFDNQKKYPFTNFDRPALENFTKSYDSILDKNKGANRFKSYDLYSTFKVDKDGTIDFLESYLKLDLVNEDDAAIENHTLLTLFNIFDSRIYFDILYNLLPETEKRKQTEDEFVKSIRARINANSKPKDSGEEGQEPIDEEDVNDNPKTSKEVMEYVSREAAKFGKMSHTDIQFCEAYQDLIRMEISCMNDLLYNEKMSDAYAESYLVSEYSTGEAPKYMREKYKIDDTAFDTASRSSSTRSKRKENDEEEEEEDTMPEYIKARLEKLGDVESSTTDYDTPSNDVSELIASILAKLNSDAPNLDAALGVGYENRSDTNNSNVVYNSTQGNPSSNNNNNSNDSSDTKDFKEYFSNGKSVEDVFTFLESEEPLSDRVKATKPKDDLLTLSMDADRKTLPLQQKAKKGLQKVTNLGKSILRPIDRARTWVTHFYDDLMKRDEDRVKREIMENDSFRGTIRKVARLALKLGMFTVFSHVSGLLAAAYAGLEVASAIDKPRIRREIQADYVAELRVLDEKIKDARTNEEKYQLMRQRDELKRDIAKSTKSFLKSSRDVL